MDITANLIEHVFLVALSLYAVVECALTILQTHAAERGADGAPERFEGKLTPALLRKAADYTGEVVQARLMRTFAGAAFALFMTFGDGLTAFSALADGLTSNALLAQWILIELVLLSIAVIDLPFHWYGSFRVAERFGYMREKRPVWLGRRMRETFAGWMLTMPITAVLIGLLEATGELWWVVGLALWVAWLFWRWMLSTAKGVFWGRRARPVEDEDLRRLVSDYLKSEGLEMADLCVMTRPDSWSHSHLVLAGFGRRRRVVVFAHAAARLTRGELLALVAHDVGHIKHFHALLRLVIFGLAGAAIFAFAGWGSGDEAFFRGFGLSTALLDRPGTHAGYVVACALVVFPILCYPLAPFVNLLARLMQYDADRFAARRWGSEYLIGALVALHRDYRTSLTTSRLYSLFHYRRPHAGMRTAQLLDEARRGFIPEAPCERVRGFCGFASALERPAFPRPAPPATEEAYERELPASLLEGPDEFVESDPRKAPGDVNASENLIEQPPEPESESEFEPETAPDDAPVESPSNDSTDPAPEYEPFESDPAPAGRGAKEMS